MIWYLLYPFRGTTEPPDLDHRHPIRDRFTRFGYNVAKHSIAAITFSAIIATLLIFPFPFLFTNDFTSGASNLPHHVWSSAQPLKALDDTRKPDVVMRSIWVHGSYMKALQSDVLQTALEIQDKILGPTVDFNPRKAGNQVLINDTQNEMSVDTRDAFHAANGLSNSSWFFHSPLQYWSCSKDAISADDDIIRTVNKNLHQSTSVNVTLRHSIVFSGKRFEDHRLVAADALVITLAHMLDSPVGKYWERRAAQIAAEGSDKWRLIPSDGRSIRSTPYEFLFQPTATWEFLALAIAYVMGAWWFVATLWGLRALKSRLGLLIAATTQLAFTFTSTFTICAIVKTDLSMIPREYYPLIVVFCGTENMLQLVRAVIITPSSHHPTLRSAEAFGKNGHIFLANTGQRLLFLCVVSKFGGEGLATFCRFATLALVFDFFYLLMFFAPILSIDVRRPQLNDTLSASRERRYSSPERPSPKPWVDFILHGGRMPSTRMVGTLVLIFAVLICQWHFDEGILQSSKHLLRASSTASASVLEVDIHQARTPTAWLRLQDHETVHELVSIIKPHAHSFVAQVYDPLVFVLNGSDRTPNTLGVRSFLPAFYDFIENQSLHFLLFVFITGVAVNQFIKYLLSDEPSDDENHEGHDDEPLLSVKTFGSGHALDVVLMTASRDGIIVSVGLDRWIRVWDAQHAGRSYVVEDPGSNIDPFPVLAMAIDNDSNWLAILSKKMVALWNIPERRWGPTMAVDVKGRTPEAFFFSQNEVELIDPVIIVRHNGLMTELHMEDDVAKELQICRTPLVCVEPHLEKVVTNGCVPPPKIITASKRGCVHVAVQETSGWVSYDLRLPWVSDDKDVNSILPLPALSSFLAIRDHSVDLVDIYTHNVTHSFVTENIKPGTLQCVHSTRRRPQCGSVGLGSFAFMYTCIETGNLMMQSYLPSREGDTICFRDPDKPGSKTCCLWRETVERRFSIENPGDWQALQSGYVVGVRKLQDRGKQATGNQLSGSIGGGGLRRRGVPDRKSHNGHPEGKNDGWEVWSLGSRGDETSVPLNSVYDQVLLVGKLGPVTKVGTNSIVVALGNVVKLITVGHERYDRVGNESDETFVGMAPAANRRKRPVLTRKRTD
ncbi:20fc050e-d275-46ff-82a9-898df7df3252 [Sclerotinia trifoliorum]|uniref:Sterol regulatory element-binding protein cleavage-activating protein n=1 Tax=Sclerotinia trifoliorum TaxID=28548 RepID=A0A8H2ZKZ8_9HELO|nr:20fc050e-d275-46ff-82a9-898df7df3252 [Sclerotinia trifoliorum]